MGLLDRYLFVRIVSAEPENLLSKLLLADLELMDITYVDSLTVEIKIRKSQFFSMQRILEKSGITYRVVRKEGILWSLQNVRRRPVLIVGVLFVLMLACVLPGRIFFINVAGNEALPEKLILSQAESCGIVFGTKAVSLRSEDIKNQLLARLPQLQWLGITTEGSVATIQVKERSEQEDLPAQSDMVSSIVAARDGVITQMTVYKGNPLYQVGQSVKAGDVLVSGYTDCGIKLKAERAQAEVFAYTLRESRFVAPSPWVTRGKLTGEHTCYRLHIGKKVINLCNHSGISDTTCVKMYSEKTWTLPGGFQLPVSVTEVRYLFYEPVVVGDAAEDAYAWLPQFAQKYLSDQMIAGEILDEKLQWDISDVGCILTGNYDCHEMIGQVKYEEIIEQNAEDN